MEKPVDMSKKSAVVEGSHSQVADDEFQKLMDAVPKHKGWIHGTFLCKYQDFWCPDIALKAVVSCQKHFEALDTDIILISTPKSGSTWLKALLFSVCSRHVYKVKDSPLLSCNPQDLVASLEYYLYRKNETPNTTGIDPSSPRLFATHIPYESLPASIKTSKCKIIYLCRNPVDCFISYWHFMNKLRPENAPELPLEEAFQMYCQGIHAFGPFWDHVLGYWKASLQTPDKVLFMKYEEIKKQSYFYTKMLAQFIGLPFSDDEEKEGVVDDIVRLCSFESLKNLEVNKKGKRPLGFPSYAFFRKGDVGDWVNFLKPNEAQQLEKMVQEKLKNSGLSFNTNFHLLQKEGSI